MAFEATCLFFFISLLVLLLVGTFFCDLPEFLLTFIFDMVAASDR